MYTYKGFGLNISSEFEIKELYSYGFGGDPDVNIAYGKTPTSLEGEDVTKKVRNWSRPGEFLLDIKDVARYHCNADGDVTVEPYDNTNKDNKSVRLFLLGSVLSAIVHLKKIVPLHASGVVYNDRVSCFMGLSGIGKSTTAAYLHTQGMQIFSDDICCIHPTSIKEDHILIHSSYPQSRMWENSIDYLAHESFDKNDSVREEVEKFSNLFHESFTVDPLPLNQIFLLSTTEKKGISINKLTQGKEKLNHLIRHVYRNGQVKGLGMATPHLMQLTQLIPKMDIYHIERNHNTDLNEFLPYVKSQVELLSNGK